MPFKLLYFFILLLTFFLVGCGNAHQQTTKQMNINDKGFQDKLIEANKIYVKQESDEIDQYVAHRGWQMITTGTGLRYMIVEKGTGAPAQLNQRAKVNFNVSLLNGTLCYSSDSTGAREFLIGKDNIESGLHEGIQYMHVGDKVILILPSHLAHGLIGDENRIPPRSSVIYELELLSLK